METGYNQKLVIQLLEIAKGSERSCRAYAMDADLNSATLSRIFTGKRKATIKHLQQLTSENAKPQGGVTLEQLATAAGYVNIQNPSTHNNYNINTVRKAKDLEMKVLGALQYNCLLKEISMDVKNESSNLYKPDIAVYMAERNWWLEIVDVDENPGQYQDISRYIFSRIMMAKPDKNRYLAIVVNSAPMFNELSSYANELAYKGNLLGVFFNECKMSFESEIVLSTYSDAKHFSLFD